MDESLLVAVEGGQILRGNGGKAVSRFGLMRREVKRVACIAAPMVAVNSSLYFLQIVSTMMVGHLGELSLSSTAIAISFSAVTGFSFMVGMASALETLSGQAYGAQEYRKLGTQTYTAMFSLFLVCIPISILWTYMGHILIFLGQDPTISHKAGEYVTCLIPALLAYAALQPLVRYFLMQSLILPMVLSSCTTLCFHIVLSWTLVYKTGLGNLGAALSTSTSYWLNVLFLVLYMNYSPNCDKTRAPVSFDVFRGMGHFFRLAIPSATMICLEWWSFELLTLLSGLLPNPQLEASVLSVCLCTITTLYNIGDGIAAGARLTFALFSLIIVVSTRVSNELGAGKPQAARLAAYTAIFLGFSESLIVSSTIYAFRHVLGYTFSYEKEVVDYVTEIAPLICLCIIINSFQAALSGIARGCGWQHIGAYVNLGAYYVVGIPVAVGLAFWLNLNGKGLFIGIQVGAFCQTVMLFIVTSCTDWDKQAMKARERVEGKLLQ